MTITAEQTAAISAELSVDLATVTDDRLIELCLLYRSAPEALPTFPDLLEAEIARRFTAAEIAANDVMFSVIQNFANQFKPVDESMQYKEKLYEFVNALDRELWLTENISFFEATLLIPEKVEWLLAENGVFNAIMTSPLAIVKLFNSVLAVNAIMNNSAMLNTVITNNLALSKIVSSNVFRQALVDNNRLFQSLKQQIYDIVSANWVKKAGLRQSSTQSDSEMTNISNAVASPVGFVFASLGEGASETNRGSSLLHFEGTEAERQIDNGLSPLNLNILHAISFDGAKAYSISFGSVFAELWSPT